MFPSPIPPPAYCGYNLLNRDFFAAVNHNSSNRSEKNKRTESINIIEEVSMGGARWTPTPEQLYALDEIYQSGTRTPSATQIQQIAARLRRFGKIEGKNVFYWFQNHKARERQKRRRQHLRNSLSPNEHLRIRGKSLGLRTCLEVGQAKNWLTPSDCSTISEDSVVSSLATAEVAKGEMDMKILFEDKGLQLELSMVSGNQKNMEFSHTSHAVDHKAQNHEKLWMPTYRDMIKTTEERKYYQTLELFPCGIDDQYQMTDGPKFDDPSEMEIATPSSKFTPTHFFEFLPLKNK